MDRDSQKSARRRGRRLVKFALQLTVTAVLLLLVYRKVDTQKLFVALSGISFLSALGLSLLYIFGQLISAAKWRIFVTESGINRSYREILPAYFLGMFFNAFGIGTVSGDLVRGIALKPERGHRAAALASVVADRIHGLTVLLTIGAVGILAVQPKPLGPSAAPLAVLIICLFAAFWWFGPKMLVALFPDGHRFSQAAHSAANAFPKNLQPLLVASALSAVFHSSQILLVYYIAQSLGAALPLGYLFAAIPVVNTAASLPFSMNGVGVREGLYLFFFAPEGVSPEMVAAMGAVWILIVTLISALGGLIPHKMISAQLGDSSEAQESPALESTLNNSGTNDISVRDIHPSEETALNTPSSERRAVG